MCYYNGEFLRLVNPFRAYDQDSISRLPYHVPPSQWHPSTSPILIDKDHPPLCDGTQEFANPIFETKITNNPLMSAY